MTKMPDQHWWLFKNYEPSDYDELMLSAQQLGAQSRDDVWINSAVSGCFDSGDRLVVQFTIRSSGAVYQATWRETPFWFESGAKQRELSSVQEYHCPVLDGGV